ncbi:Sua5/YciO/YrdC/YwlC family protein [Candidatus Woesearchaeota archaeon]|nr:Sua5/YciO/YrdC/YwlC family protein [Candidatus Woesearchaeota archaeon]
MRSLTKEEFFMLFDEMKIEIEDGAIFIHPTDTTYGIGCDATNKHTVMKIRDIKSKHIGPFPVIAPSKKWILDNCIIGENSLKWLGKLPGPYTLILRLKNKSCIAKNVNFGLDSLAVRIPDNWFSEAVTKIGKPILSTIANKSGTNFMTCLENLESEIEEEVSFILYEGEKTGRPSTLVDLTGDDAVITKR